MDRKLAATIGIAARTARQRAKLTQADVAERVDLSAEVYGRLERGNMLPSVETLRRLSAALAVSADELLGLAHDRKASRFAEPQAAQDDAPEFRRLMRRVRRLTQRRVRLLGLLAEEFTRPIQPPHRGQ
jgi:transcriptional regulator with XRE-family HTH domain